jgi:hypothetical protein
MEDMWRLSTADLAKLIKSKEVSAKEATTAALARLDAVNPRINAVVDHNPADALAQASVVDAAIARGDQLGELGTASRLGVRRRSPSAEMNGSLAGISVHWWNRTCHCRRRNEPAAGDRRRVATIASAAIYATGCGFLKAVEFGCKTPWS